jgi:acyl-CoA thioester hydrolase
MIVRETNIRVCYGDTDKMGVVYHGTYARFFEVGRNEWLRSFGITYRDVEEAGIVWPVRNLQITFFKPACYDDLLTIRTMVQDLPLLRFHIRTEIYNESGELLCHGEVTLISTNPQTGKPVKTPQWLIEKLKFLEQP